MTASETHATGRARGPLTVLHLVKGLGPGGAERLLVSLCGARGADVEFHVAYLLPQKSHLVAELEAAGATVHLIGGRRGLAGLGWILRLRALVRTTRPTALHVHSPALAPAARISTRLSRRRPVLVSTDQNVWPSYRRPTRFMNGITVPLSDCHVAVSAMVRDSMWSPLRSSTPVLPNGIPARDLAERRVERDAARASLGVRPDDIVVASVANFREKKDHPTLFAAAAECRDDPRLRFLVIGQGPLEPALRELHWSLGLERTVMFLGHHPDPPALVAGADLFTLSSVHEGLPIAMLEAMAMGVPPVVTEVGGVAEVVTDGVDGVLVPPRRPDLLAAAFRGLARDDARRRRLGDGAARRAAHYDVERTQRAYETIYVTGRADANQAT